MVAGPSQIALVGSDPLQFAVKVELDQAVQLARLVVDGLFLAVLSEFRTTLLQLGIRRRARRRWSTGRGWGAAGGWRHVPRSCARDKRRRRLGLIRNDDGDAAPNVLRNVPRVCLEHGDNRVVFDEFLAELGDRILTGLLVEVLEQGHVGTQFGDAFVEAPHDLNMARYKNGDFLFRYKRFGAGLSVGNYDGDGVEDRAVGMPGPAIKFSANVLLQGPGVMLFFGIAGYGLKNSELSAKTHFHRVLF